MRTLTRIIAPALVIATALGASASASAADWRHDGRGDRHYGESRFAPDRADWFRQEVNELRRDIDRASARRAISPREAAGLHRDLTAIEKVRARYGHNGVDRAEGRALERRLDRIRMALRMERHDRDDRRH